MRLRSLLSATLVAVSLACTRDAPQRSLPSRDDFGTPGAAAALGALPSRIVSLNPTTTELLFSLGAGARVVGRTHWDLWPDSARLVPDLGPGLRPNVESVLARHPDLVILYASADNRAAADRLRAAGVEVIALKIDRLADFRRATTLIGDAIGESARAREVISHVDSALASVQRATATLPRPRVVWHVWDAPVIVIGGGSYMNELIDIAGGTNLYADLAGPSPSVSLEDIIRRAPDYIIAGPDGAAHMRADAAWRAVPAVRAGHILVVDTSLVGRPSVRLGEAAASLARLMHPGVLP